MEDRLDPEYARERSIRRAFEDGIEEIYIGLFVIVMAAIYFWAFKLPKGSKEAQIIATIASTIQWAIIMVLMDLRNRVKATYVFPRTGYVKVRIAKCRTQLFYALAFAAVTVAIVFLLRKSLIPDLSAAAGPLAAAVFAAALLWGGIRYEFPHLIWLSLFSAVLGLATFLIGVRALGMFWVALGVGAAMAVIGAVRFRVFLKTHPISGGLQ